MSLVCVIQRRKQPDVRSSIHYCFHFVFWQMSTCAHKLHSLKWRLSCRTSALRTCPPSCPSLFLPSSCGVKILTPHGKKHLVPSLFVWSQNFNSTREEAPWINWKKKMSFITGEQVIISQDTMIADATWKHGSKDYSQVTWGSVAERVAHVDPFLPDVIRFFSTVSSMLKFYPRRQSRTMVGSSYIQHCWNSITESGQVRGG